MEEDKVLKQVNFYFCDANFAKDKFLKEESKKNDGWIPISTIASFSRMKQLTTDVDQIVKALTTTEGENNFEIDQEGKNIRKKKSLPEDYNVEKLSVMLQGFPEEATVDEITKELSTQMKLSAVRMQRDRTTDKKFIGKAIVVLESEDEVKRVLASDQEIRFGETKIVASAIEATKKRKEDTFVYGRLLKLDNVKDSIMEVVIKEKMKETYPDVGYVKRLPEGLFALLREPTVDAALKSFTDTPLLLEESETPVSISKVEDKEEEKRIIIQIQSKPGKHSGKRRR